MSKDEKYIKVIKQGPYEVYGNPKVTVEKIVTDEDGASWEYEKGKEIYCKENPTALCRCGQSKNAPHCDGSHVHADWDGEEAKDFEPIMNEAEAIEGPNLTLFDNEKYCAYARFCDAKGRVWNLVQMGTKETDELAVREACNCCAGRLMIYDNKTRKPIEPQLEQEIAVLEDKPLKCSGPLYVKGGIPVESEDGRRYEVRNRQTLCRCGRSSHKPFCDGSHASPKRYRDGIED